MALCPRGLEKLFKPHLILLALFAVTLLFSPPVHSLLKVDPESERKVGRETDKEIQKQLGIFKDKKLGEFVDRVGQKLVSNIDDPIFTYYFKIVDTHDVNAFALPGGYIYVTRGLLAYMSSEAELAAVLGHEIGHVTSHHGFKQMEKSIGATLLTIVGLMASDAARADPGAWVVATQTLSQHMLSGYGREAEMQSDELGIIYSYYAGYDPRAVTDFFRKLKAMEKFGGHSYHGFLASHPETIERIITTASKSDAMYGRGKGKIVNRDSYLKLIDGLPYGKKRGKDKKRTRTEYKIKIVEAKESGVYSEVMKDLPHHPGTLLESAILNGIRMNSKVSKGELLKVIVKSYPTVKNNVKDSNSQ